MEKIYVLFESYFDSVDWDRRGDIAIASGSSLDVMYEFVKKTYKFEGDIYKLSDCSSSIDVENSLIFKDQSPLEDLSFTVSIKEIDFLG